MLPKNIGTNPTRSVCSRCAMGVDDDGDGNCPFCARLTDDELHRLLETPYQFTEREAAKSSTSVTTFTSTRDKGRSV